MFKKLLILQILLFFSSASFALDAIMADGKTAEFDVITLDDYIIDGVDNMKLNIKSAGFFDTFKMSQQDESKMEYKKGNVSFFTQAKKDLNKYMVEDYKTTTGVNIKAHDRFLLSTGVDVKCQNPDANINTKKVFFTPVLKLTDDISFSFANTVNQDNLNYEQEVGLQYSPKYIKNTSFGFKAGTVWEENIIKSQSIKFSTDLFIR